MILQYDQQLRNQAAGLQQNMGDPANVASRQLYYPQPKFVIESQE